MLPAACERSIVVFATTGIHVHRFANRIPLIFETGSDIVTVVALKEIKWGACMFRGGGGGERKGGALVTCL